MDNILYLIAGGLLGVCLMIIIYLIFFVFASLKGAKDVDFVENHYEEL